MEIAQRVQLLNDRFSVMQELLDILRVHVQVGKSCGRASDRCERVHVREGVGGWAWHACMHACTARAGATDTGGPGSRSAPP